MNLVGTECNYLQKYMKNRVGLGTFPLAGVFNPISKIDAEKIVRSFIDQSGYYIDTAPLYGLGDVEEMLGEALKDVPRKKYYVITKGGKVITPEKQVITSGTYKDTIKECENSLRRLRVDYIDLYMIHSPDPNTPFSETMEAMKRLKKEGKILQMAVSNVSLKELKEFNKDGEISYVQNRFSLINRSLNKEFTDYLLQHKIFLIPYHLLEIGLLTGIASENFKLRKGDLREALLYWNKENQDVIFSWVRKNLSPLAKKLNITIGQLNIAWALLQKFINFVVIGTTKQEYLGINLKANNIILSEKTQIEINHTYSELENKIKVMYNMPIRQFRGLNEKYY